MVLLLLGATRGGPDGLGGGGGGGLPADVCYKVCGSTTDTHLQVNAWLFVTSSCHLYSNRLPYSNSLPVKKEPVPIDILGLPNPLGVIVPEVKPEPVSVTEPEVMVVFVAYQLTGENSN